MSKKGIIILAAVTTALFSINVSANTVPAQHVRDLMSHSIVLDTHDDTTQRFIWEKFDLGQRDSAGSIDITRMRAGGMNAIFFSIWMPGTVTGTTAVKRALQQIDAIREQVRQHPHDLALCTSVEQIHSAHAKGKIAVLMGMEGGHMINNNLANLRRFANLGVRYMTLTHSVNTDWADSSTDKPVHNGLSTFGKKIVHEMNRLGMIVDISHVSDKTFYDALAISQSPMIASHSSCRAICDAPRNMTDDMIKALAAKGGVIQINYNMSFISQEYLDAEKNSAAMAKFNDDIKQRCGANDACIINGSAAYARKLAQEGKLPIVGWEKIIEHINHVVKIAGVDHVGLGSDFDGAIMPFGMEDAAHLPQITEALLAHGYSDTDIQKILGGNTLRVMAAVKATAIRLQKQ